MYSTSVINTVSHYIVMSINTLVCCKYSDFLSQFKILYERWYGIEDKLYVSKVLHMAKHSGMSS